MNEEEELMYGSGPRSQCISTPPPSEFLSELMAGLSRSRFGLEGIVELALLDPVMNLRYKLVCREP